MSVLRPPSKADLAAFEGFVVRHETALGGLAKGLANNAADAEDLLQETLTKVLAHWRRVEQAEDPYLYARLMMVNTSTSTWRRRHREQNSRSAEHVLATGRLEQRPLWAGNAAAVDVNDDRGAVVAVLRGLPPRQRAVVVLRYPEDLPDEEIAALLGVRPSTVRSTALRALRVLRGPASGMQLR
ncbi:sigma-70 family RNA polymerase sigma factor [Streptomyces sp. NP160]|uniref:sigma-70 family RNA polymerase sigma factor n=1 Tax=Streptomyces sp. NP160 TaxID=2586637 RepID=UPI0011181EC2|nr:sigma-70 family RNA polymerase sigma factor [Streptomyces sp. NP160]TNM67608.1 sigma-70 family RNA polymerase sigma factor [Streptomyces sp. NP160]